MSGRPVRRRVLAAVERAGGWQIVLGRIASGESVARIARTFGVSRGFFSGLLHQDRDRHELAVEARRRAAGHKVVAEAVTQLSSLAGPAAQTGARPVEVGGAIR